MVRQIIRYTFEKSISVCVFIREDSARTCRILEAYYSTLKTKEKKTFDKSFNIWE